MFHSLQTLKCWHGFDTSIDLVLVIWFCASLQLLRRDEQLYGMLMKPKRPRAIVLCPTRELCEQVLLYFFPESLAFRKL